MLVSVLTAALPSRRHMLDEAIASVRAQTHTEVEHLYAFDEKRQGAPFVLNRLLEEAMGDWVMVLDDDDLLDPNHLETLLAHADEADVLYSLPRVEGAVFRQYHMPFDELTLGRLNIVSHTMLVRRRFIEPWPDVRWFDWWQARNLVEKGAEFLQIPEETWTYRLHGSNWSQGTLEEATL